MKKYILILATSVAGFASAQGVDVEAYNRLVRIQIQALQYRDIDLQARRISDANAALDKAMLEHLATLQLSACMRDAKSKWCIK
jgi:hypothetical protein